jgi:hypothetical protein
MLPTVTMKSYRRTLVMRLRVRGMVFDKPPTPLGMIWAAAMLASAQISARVWAEDAMSAAKWQKKAVLALPRMVLLVGKDSKGCNGHKGRQYLKMKGYPVGFDMHMEQELTDIG